MPTDLRATFTRCYRDEPLAVIDGLPGGGAEMRPAQLRALAAALLQIAADCDATPAPKKRPLLPASKRYSVDAA
ncbi:MAG: hypothetical protein KGI90_10105 [Burkholderiales bacterium]|nr:hypothetical protein [Burkholderiales bacterium]